MAYGKKAALLDHGDGPIISVRRPAYTMRIQDIAHHLNARLEPSDLDLDIHGVATIDEATAQDITFLTNTKYLSKIKASSAGAIIVPETFVADGLTIPLVRVAYPDLAFAQAIELFHPKSLPKAAIHPTAVLGQNVQLGQNVFIGPYVVIGDRVTIADNVVIHAHCAIYDDVVIGADSVIHSHVALREAVKVGSRVIIHNGTVIGADGFRFVPLQDGSFHKVPQPGTVVLEDDVEVQAISAIDRATLGATRIGQGSKIDDLVQVGHNSTIGRHSLLCGQVGLAGSTQIGNHVVLAGKVGASGHLTIGDGAMAGAGAGIVQSVAPGTQVSGYPAIEHRLWLKIVATIKQLPEIAKRLRKLEKYLGMDEF